MKYFAYQEGRERNNQSICPNFRPQLPALKARGWSCDKSIHIKIKKPSLSSAELLFCLVCNLNDLNCVCTITPQVLLQRKSKQSKHLIFQPATEFTSCVLVLVGNKLMYARHVNQCYVLFPLFFIAKIYTLN